MAAADGSVPTRPRFDADVAPILREHCAHCHNAETRQGELNLNSLATLLVGGEAGQVIRAGHPEESLLYEYLRDGMMPPKDEPRLAAKELETIRDWIEFGLEQDARELEAVRQLTQHDVLPRLLLRCGVCHGARQREGGLDVRSRESLLRGGRSGPAIELGKPEESLLLKRLHAGEMPPRQRVVEVSVKPMEASEVELVSNWIARGAPEVQETGPAAQNIDDPDPLVRDSDRDFWAFRAPVAPAVPVVQSERLVRNPIDAFILQKLEAVGLSLSPEADRGALLRRLTFDLTGLPAEIEQVEDFLADQGVDAYEKVVDRLLSSPAYGERWARHWLDVAGYADSEGKREQDLPRPWAYRYRDYVIRSLNDDKSYDRFLLEQIAGDELADYEQAAVITPEIHDNLVATGFLRMAPDPTWACITAFVPDRLEVMADEVEILGSAVMGLTLKCARCHSHKFDPLPQRDYYGLVAIFKGALDEHDWLKPDWHPSISMGSRAVRQLPHVTTQERTAWQQREQRIQGEIAAIQARLAEQTRDVMDRVGAERLAQLPEVLRADLEAMLATDAKDRNEVQRYLAEKFEAWLRPSSAELQQLDAEFMRASQAAESQVQTLQQTRAPEPAIHALWDRGEPSPTYTYRRGDYLQPGTLVEPRVPSMLTDGHFRLEIQPPWPGAKKTGRRLAFARWLIRQDHPLTARVMVNRVWRHHFGNGIVETLGNFGRSGAAPSHPELLDWLATEFVRQGFSIKAIHRLMVTSSTYRQSSQVREDHARIDPQNRLWSRMPLRRLSAEEVYDSLLRVSACLDTIRFGPADALVAHADGRVAVAGTPRGWRRGIYAQQQRKQVPTLLEAFDLPAMNPNCSARAESTVALQALHLSNDEQVQLLARRFAERVAREAGADTERQIEHAWRLALGRLPTDEERPDAVSTLLQLTAAWNAQLVAQPEPNVSLPTQEEAALRGLTNVCHGLLNSAEFLYVD